MEIILINRIIKANEKRKKILLKNKMNYRKYDTQIKEKRNSQPTIIPEQNIPKINIWK